jgi:protein arginine N-methyltransferase 1
MHGVLPLFEQNLPSLIDARRRLLAPDGVMIPRQETLWVAAVEAPDLYSRYTAPWDDNGHGLDLQVARRIVTNTWSKCRVTPEQLLVEPQCWAMLEYVRLESPDVVGNVTWRVARAGTGHGLSVWFDAILHDGVTFSNAPNAPELIYGSAFFPWSTPVSVTDGDTVSVMLHADLIGDDYVWRWETRVLDRDHPGQLKANFKQSTLFSALLSQSRLRKLADNHVPTLNEDGQIDQFILAMMSGDASVGEIASRVCDRFPGRFSAWQDALTHVGELSEKYSR